MCKIICFQYKLFALRKTLSFAKFSMKTITGQLPFHIKKFTGLYQMYSEGLVGRMKDTSDGRIYNYFITYRGRRFLAQNGDKSQIKYLNLQNA